VWQEARTEALPERSHGHGPDRPTTMTTDQVSTDEAPDD
jgi:hypothetical protein